MSSKIEPVKCKCGAKVSSRVYVQPYQNVKAGSIAYECDACGIQGPWKSGSEAAVAAWNELMGGAVNAELVEAATKFLENRNAPSALTRALCHQRLEAALLTAAPALAAQQARLAAADRLAEAGLILYNSHAAHPVPPHLVKEHNEAAEAFNDAFLAYRAAKGGAR